MLTVTLPEPIDGPPITYLIGISDQHCYCNGWLVEPGGRLVMVRSIKMWFMTDYEHARYIGDRYAPGWLEQYLAAHDEALRDLRG